MPAAERDLEHQQAGDQETDPLLIKEEAHKAKEALGIADRCKTWWTNDATPSFRESLKYSIRVAFWVVIIALVPLSMPNGRKMFAEHGFNIAYIVVNFLFMIGPNVGATICGATGAVFGNFWAGFAFWVLNGMYPGGYQGSDDLSSAVYDQSFLVGVFWCTTFIFIVMMLNISDGVRFFVLYNFLGYTMSFLKPGLADASVSTAFSLNYKGLAENGVLLCVIAAVIAILCSVLPTPKTARRELIHTVQELSEHSIGVTHRIVNYYSGTSPTMTIWELVGEIDEMKPRLDDARARLTDTWFECFGIGARGVSNVLLAEIITTLERYVMRLQPMVPIASREKFNDSHKKIMAKVGEPLCDLVTKMEALITVFVSYSKDGNIDEHEEAEMKAHVKDVRRAMKAVSNALMSSKTEVAHGVQTLGEVSFAQSLCSLAGIVIGHAEKMMDEEGAAKIVANNTLLAQAQVNFAPKKLFAEFADPVHLWWSFRNILALFIAMLIGYHGWAPGCKAIQSVKPEASCFIRPYSAGPAQLVVVLMSTSSTGTLKASLDRVAAVVLANVTGALAWILMGWCTFWGRFATGIAIIVLVQPGMYVWMRGGDYASLGMRVAAIAAMMVLSPCSSDFLTHTSYSANYHDVIDAIIGVYVLLTVDMVFGARAPSRTARDKVAEFLVSFNDVTRSFFFEMMPVGEVVEKLKSVQSVVDSMLSDSVAAEQEPRWWLGPHRKNLHCEVARCYTLLCHSMHNLAFVTGVSVHDTKREKKDLRLTMASLVNYEKIRTDIVQEAKFVADAVQIIVDTHPHEQNALFRNKDVHKRSEEHGDLKSFLAELEDYLTSNLNVMGEKGYSIELDENTRLSTAVEILRSINDQLSDTEQKIMQYKHR